MSACISSHGEFSSHVFDDKDPLTCTLCHVFDEEEARARLVELEARVASPSDAATAVACRLETLWERASGFRDTADQTWAGGFRMVTEDGARFVVRVEQVEP